MRKKVVVQEKPSIFRLRNILLVAGAAVLVPYIIRRVMPLLTENPEGTSAQDLIVAGKDSIRDAADDFGVGGFTGTMKRGVNRVADHLS